MPQLHYLLASFQMCLPMLLWLFCLFLLSSWFCCWEILKTSNKKIKTLNRCSHGERTVRAGQPHSKSGCLFLDRWSVPQSRDTHRPQGTVSPVRAVSTLLDWWRTCGDPGARTCKQEAGSCALRTAQAASPLVPPEAGHIIVALVNGHPYVDWYLQMPKWLADVSAWREHVSQTQQDEPLAVATVRARWVLFCGFLFHGEIWCTQDVGIF